MTHARFIVGDARATLRGLPDASVDLVITSPPFLALRSYLPADHPAKAAEIGTEPTPGEFLDALLDIVEECRRVLTPHGSLCFELGDTYSGSGGGGGDYLPGGLREGQQQFAGSAASMRESNAAHWRQKNRRKPNDFPDRDDTPRPNRNGRRVRSEDEAAGILQARSRPGPEQRDNNPGWPLDKSLCLVAESFRWALAYGRNPFTGRTLAPWRIRNVVRWVRPNPPVGALGDKFRPATSDIVVACTSKTRWFDLDAVKQPLADSPGNRYVRKVSDVDTQGRDQDGATANKITKDYDPALSAGAPPLDWWKVNARGYTGSHYATYPPELIDRLIKAMCPQRVCTTCGEPSRRITEKTDEYAAARAAVGDSDRSTGLNGTTQYANGKHMESAEMVTTGWTDCGHNTWRKGVVLDPFAGTGTTLAVATGHGHDAIGIDLDERNADLAAERVGFFLTVEVAAGAVMSPQAATDPKAGTPAPTNNEVTARCECGHYHTFFGCQTEPAGVECDHFCTCQEYAPIDSAPIYTQDQPYPRAFWPERNVT